MTSKVFLQKGVPYIQPKVILFAISARFVLFNSQEQKIETDLKCCRHLGVEEVDVQRQVLMITLS